MLSKAFTLLNKNLLLKTEEHCSSSVHLLVKCVGSFSGEFKKLLRTTLRTASIKKNDSFTLFICAKTITKLNLGHGDKFEIEILKLAVVVHALQTAQNLVVSRFCFAGDGKEMYIDL